MKKKVEWLLTDEGERLTDIFLERLCNVLLISAALLGVVAIVANVIWAMAGGK